MSSPTPAALLRPVPVPLADRVAWSGQSHVEALSFPMIL